MFGMTQSKNLISRPVKVVRYPRLTHCTSFIFYGSGIKKMARLTLICCLLLLVSCTTIKYTTSDLVSGEWESFGFVYLRLSMDETGNGFVVAPLIDDENLVFEVRDYLADEDGLTVTINQLENEDFEHVSFRGVLDEFNTLCFTEKDGDEDYPEEFCFKRISDLNKLRDEANRVIDALNNKKANSTGTSSLFFDASTYKNRMITKVFHETYSTRK